MYMFVLVILTFLGGGGLKVGVGNPRALPFCMQPCKPTNVDDVATGVMMADAV